MREGEREIACEEGQREGGVNYVLTLERITFGTERACYGCWV